MHTYQKRVYKHIACVYIIYTVYDKPLEQKSFVAFINLCDLQKFYVVTNLKIDYKLTQETV